MKIAALLLLSCLPLAAQTITFKNNRLGMTLEEFKQANKGQPVWVNTGDPTRRLNKKLSRQVDTPLCTDTMDGFEGSDVLGRNPEEVICNVSPGIMNPGAKMVGDMDMRSIIYRFYRGRLYEVDLSFRTIQFIGMRNAFADKFGPQSSAAKTDCQNGFGARWSGDSVDWNPSTTVSAVLVEGCQNGPGQNSFDGYSGGNITDSSLGPAPTVANRAPVF